MSIDFYTYLPNFLNGLIITLILTLSSIMIGLVLAILFTMGSYSNYFLVRKPIAAFVFFICGTPLLVQIFLLYYGAGQFEWIRSSSLWFVLREPMACAIIAFSINSACYTSVLFKGAIHSVPSAEVDACKVLAMSKWLAFRRIIFPRAFRIAIPAYSNEVIMILKGTSLASTITILDLMGVTQTLISETYKPVELYLIAGALYLLLNIIIIFIFKKLQRWAVAYYNL